MALQIHVPTMVCDGCTDTVTTAIHSIDTTAVVTVDLGTKIVTIVTSTSTPEALSEAIAATGHTVSS
jgi:copper chaperone